MPGSEGKASISVDLSPVVDLINDVREEVRGVRTDVAGEVRSLRDGLGTLSDKVAEISVDHATRITRTEERLVDAEKDITALEGRLVNLEPRVTAVERNQATGSAVSSAVDHVETKRLSTLRFRLSSLLGVAGACSGWAVLIYYLVK